MVMDCLGSIAVLGALRGTWRLYREQFWPILNPSNFRWALLVGSDHAAGVLASQMQSYRELPYRVRGLLAMDEGMVGSRLGQIPVLGKAGRRPRNRRRVLRQHGAGHRGHARRLAPAESDDRLQGIGPGTEDHPPHPGPLGRRPSHSHPRHRDQRLAPPRPGPIGHEHHRPADRRPYCHGHGRGRQHRLGNLPPVAAIQSRARWSWWAGARIASSRSSASCTRLTRRRS